MTVGALVPFVAVVIGVRVRPLDGLRGLPAGPDRGVRRQRRRAVANVRRGLQHTGRVITSAALPMVIVFACFAAARMGSIEQIGLGLAVAVLIDATIVRCLLVPASMTLLGRWNWWSPAWLTRVHARIELREFPLPRIRGTLLTRNAL